jgi:integrase
LTDTAGALVVGGMRSTKPRVLRWKWGGENSAWVIEGMRDEMGKRVRKFFRSRDDANEWLMKRRPELRSQGRAAMALSDAERVDAVRAAAVLAPHGVSLTAAAEAFHDRAKRLSRTVPFSTLRDELVAAKRADRKSSRYLSDLKNRLASAGQTFDDRPVAAIEPRELDDWLRGLGLSPTSRINFQKVLHTAFEFAVMRGYATENPVAKTAKVKAYHQAPGILTPKEIGALLAEADPQVAAAIALSAFAGLRDAEAERVTWERIDLIGGHIKIDAGVAKTASRRLVPISANLRAWLTPLSRKEGKIRPLPRISYPLYRAARKAAAAKLLAAGEPAKNLQEWPSNALRHSFASYRLALVANAAQVAEECGHSVQIMKQHYRELVTPAEALAWFAVMPPG